MPHAAVRRRRRGLPRMVRDLARSLGKQVKLEIVGGATQVDRDILAKLDAPLGHLLRNAVDHGIESPEEREAAGKPPEGLVRLEARHSAGALQIIVTDDGPGVDLDRLRDAVVARNLTTREAARALSEAELLEFLFLPGFTHEGRGHRDLRPRRRPRRRAGHGQAGARHGPRLVAGGQGHAVSAAAAADAVGGPHAARGDRRRAVRLSARLHRPDAQVVRRTGSSCSKAASTSTSTAGTSAWSRRARYSRPRRRRRPATTCR